MAEPDIATSVDEEQNQGIVSQTLDQLSEIPEGVVTGGVKFVSELNNKLDAVTGGAVEATSDFLEENVADLGALGTDSEGKVIYASSNQEAKRLMAEANNQGLQGAEIDAYVRENTDVYNLTDGLQTFTGNMASGVAQFLGGFLITRKILSPIKPTTKRGKITKLAAEGAGAEMLAFDAYEERVSNILANNEVLQVPYANYLAADPDDPKALALLKQAAEGIMMEGALLPFITGVRAIKAMRSGNQVEAKRLAEETATQVEAMPIPLKEETQKLIKARATIIRAYDEADELSGAERAKVQKQGREAGLEDMTDAQREKLADEGAGVTITNEELDAQATAAIQAHFSQYGRSLESTQALAAQFKGKPREAVGSLSILKNIALDLDDQLQLKKKEVREGTATQKEADDIYEAVLEVENLLRAGGSNFGRGLEFTKSYRGWGINTRADAMAADSVLTGSARSNFRGNLAKYAHVIHKAGAKGIAIVNELFINSILSGIKTHMINVGSNTFVMATRPLEQFAGAALRMDKKEMLSVLRTYHGLAMASKQSGKAFVQALKTGQVRLDVDFQTLEATDKAIGGIAGEVLRLPTRLLAAEDEFFKQMNFRAGAYADIAAEADLQMLTGKDRKVYIQGKLDEVMQAQLESNINKHLRATPESVIAKKNIQKARENTFTQPLGGSSGNEQFSEFIQDAVNRWPIFRQINPFIRTPLNLLSYSLQRSPLAPLSGRWRNDIKAGGQAAGEAYARWGASAAFVGLLWDTITSDEITGSGVGLTPEQRDGMREIAGVQPNSIFTEEGIFTVDGQTTNLSRLSPASDLILVMANMRELYRFAPPKENTEWWEKMNYLTIGLTSTMSEFMRDKTFLAGVDDAMNAMENPERYGKDYFSKRLGALIPYSAFMRQFNGDPALRELQQFADGLKSNTPGLSQTIDPARNALGEVIKPVPYWGYTHNFEIGLVDENAVSLPDTQGTWSGETFVDLAGGKTDVKVKGGISTTMPIGLAKERTDPIAVAFKEAWQNNQPFNIGHAPKTKAGVDLLDKDFRLKLDGKPVNAKKPTQSAYDRWREVTSKVKGFNGLRDEPATLRQTLEDYIQSPLYNMTTASFTLGKGKDAVQFTGSREKIIRKIIGHYRNAGWEYMVGKNPYELSNQSGVFDPANPLLLKSVKGAENQRLAIAYWTQRMTDDKLSQSPEGVEWMKGNQQSIQDRINGIFTGGNN